MGRLLALSLLIVLFISGCGRDGSFGHVRNLESRGEAVVCFGDSLTEGVGAANGEDYPSLLGQQLKLPIVNAGRRGETTADALARLEQDVLAQNPRLVIVLLGGNDFLRQLPIGETRKNLEEIVRRIQERGAMVAILGMRLGFFTDEYGPLYEEIAKKQGALYVPEVLKGILADPKLKSDGVHPNGAGYRLMAERVFNEVKPLLEEADRRR